MVQGGPMRFQNLKYIFLPIVGLSLMGNKGCDDAKNARLLRMDVEIGEMKTLPLMVDDQRQIQIDQLTRELFARSIYSHKHFTVVNNMVSPPRQTGGTSAFQKTSSVRSEVNSSYTENDLKMLEEYGFQLESQKVDNQFHAKLDGEVPHCQWESPQLRLNSDVLGFELVNRAKLGIGYSPSGTHLDQLTGKVKFVNFRLDYGIMAIHPLLNRMVASTEAKEFQSSVEVEFDFGQNSPITIDFFFQEPLVKVIKNGMSKALDRLVKRLKDQTTGEGRDWNKDVWESRVLLDPTICGNDDCVAIRGGTLNRIKLGDRFTVTNMFHTWEGNPCESNLIRSVPDPSAVNEIVIESVGDTVSIGRVQSKDVRVLADPGAMVKVQMLNEPEPESKKKK